MALKRIRTEVAEAEVARFVAVGVDSAALEITEAEVSEEDLEDTAGEEVVACQEAAEATVEDAAVVEAVPE